MSKYYYKVVKPIGVSHKRKNKCIGEAVGRIGKLLGVEFTDGLVLWMKSSELETVDPTWKAVTLG